MQSRHDPTRQRHDKHAHIQQHLPHSRSGSFQQDARLMTRIFDEIEKITTEKSTGIVGLFRDFRKEWVFQDRAKPTSENRN